MGPRVSKKGLRASGIDMRANERGQRARKRCEGKCKGGQRNERMDGIFPGLCPLAGSLLNKVDRHKSRAPS